VDASACTIIGRKNGNKGESVVVVVGLSRSFVEVEEENHPRCCCGMIGLFLNNDGDDDGGDGCNSALLDLVCWPRKVILLDRQPRIVIDIMIIVLIVFDVVFCWLRKINVWN